MKASLRLLVCLGLVLVLGFMFHPLQAVNEPSAAYKPEPLPPSSHWVDQLPSGDAKSLVVQRCAFCHDLERVVAFARTRDEWRDVVETMVERGAPVPQDKVPMVADYLAKSLGPHATHPLGSGCAAQISDPSTRPAIPIRGNFSLWVADQEGASVDIIDPAVNQVVYRVNCLSGPEAVIFSPDRRKAYITDREQHSLVVVDTRTGTILGVVPVQPLGDRPNWAVITKDGKRVFVGIWPLKPDEISRGFIDVVDTNTLKVVKVIPTKGAIHDLWMAPDGKDFIAGSVMGKFLNVYDTKTEKLVWSIQFDVPVTTMTIDANPDGSTRRAFIGHEIPGFGVVNFASHKEVARITFPGDYSAHPGSAHGFDITPDGKSLWLAGMNSGAPSYNNAYEYSLPDLKLLGVVHMSELDQVGHKTGRVQDGHWLCFSPDSKTVYVAVHGLNVVSVIDIKSMKEVARIPVGEGPLVISTLDMGHRN